MNLRWSWDEQTRDLFRWVDPDAVGRHPARPRPAPRPPWRPSGSRPSPPTRPSSRFLDRGRRRAHPLPRPAPLVPERPGRQPARPGRLLLPRVRHRRGPPAVLGRPRRAGRRPPQGRQPTSACRSSASACSTATATSARASAADGWQQERYPDLDPHAMAHPAVRRHHASASTWPASRCVCPGLAGRRRPDAALPARHRRRGQPAAPPPGHRPALRRRHRAPAPPGDRPRHRRRAGPAGARASTPRCSTPTRATPASSASSASASSSRAGPVVHRGARGGAGRRASSPPTRRCPAGIDRFPRELMERYFDGLRRRGAASPSTS